MIAAFGLSFTQFADVLIAMLPEVMDEFKLLFSGLAVAIYVVTFLVLMLGALLGRRNKWIYLAVAVIYLMDAGIAFWLEDYLGLIIHAIPLFILFRAIHSLNQLEKLDQADDPLGYELKIGALDLSQARKPLTILFWLLAVLWVVLLAAVIFLFFFW